MEIINAKIESTKLGYEDHGLLTIFLHLDFGGTRQGFGGYCLDRYEKSTSERVPNVACGLWVQNILQVIDADNWEDLKGKYIRVERESGWNGKITRIGNLLEEKWFDPKSEL